MIQGSLRRHGDRRSGAALSENATYVKGRVREAVDGAPPPVRWVVFDAEAISGMDATGVEALRDVVDALRADGIGSPSPV
jgi:MFS superfamily sulfate permease-like transporter